jgi:short-subunit dehydrogenase
MFQDQVAVITAASSGIGAALARELAAAGCRLGLLARRGPELERLAEELRSRGGTAAVAVADVADREATLAAVGRLTAELGPADLLIANAGVGVPTLLEPLNVPDVERMFRVNLFGVIYAIEAVLPAMLARRRGHLVGVSSLAAYKGLPGQSGYCASKAAVRVYLEGLRIRLRGTGVAVTTVCPGFVRTAMTADQPAPMPFLMDADEAARRMVRAIRRRRKVFNFPWPLALLMRGARWAPDWFVARVTRRVWQTPPGTE